MNYRFEISLPDSSEFRCEIAIAGEQTFQQLHDKIVEVLEYDASQMASFYMVDKMGNRGKEIALMDMSEDEEESDTLVMDSTTIAEVISPSCIELEYVYDFFNNKYFKVEYAGEYIADSADILPVCVYCDGNIPEQSGFGPGEDWGLRNRTRSMTIVLWRNLMITAMSGILETTRGMITEMMKTDTDGEEEGMMIAMRV